MCTLVEKTPVLMCMCYFEDIKIYIFPEAGNVFTSVQNILTAVNRFLDMLKLFFTAINLVLLKDKLVVRTYKIVLHLQFVSDVQIVFADD